MTASLYQFQLGCHTKWDPSRKQTAHWSWVTWGKFNKGSIYKRCGQSTQKWQGAMQYPRSHSSKDQSTSFDPKGQGKKVVTRIRRRKMKKTGWQKLYLASVKDSGSPKKSSWEGTKELLSQPHVPPSFLASSQTHHSPNSIGNQKATEPIGKVHICHPLGPHKRMDGKESGSRRARWRYPA